MVTVDEWKASRDADSQGSVPSVVGSIEDGELPDDEVPSPVKKPWNESAIDVLQLGTELATLKVNSSTPATCHTNKVTPHLSAISKMLPKEAWLARQESNTGVQEGNAEGFCQHRDGSKLGEILLWVRFSLA
jgi:hypothetical protein